MNRNEAPPLPPEPIHEKTRLISVSQSAPGLDALDFVRQAQGQARFYWNDHDPITFAGAGIATEIFAWGDNRYEVIQQKARALFADALVHNDGAEPLAVPRLFGGFAFRDDFVPDNTWSNFHPAHFVLPHYQLLQHGREAWLTINAQIPTDETPHDIIPALHAALQDKYETLLNGITPPQRLASTPDKTHQLNYPMSQSEWTALIEEARHEIGAGSFQKVVLSRVAEIKFDDYVNIDNVLSYLNLHYPECYRFLFEPRPQNAFYGATPELLVKVENTAVRTMGLAGSARRGATPAEDRALTLDLFNSKKDRHEHQLVVDAIQRRLTPLTTQLDLPPYPQIYTLSNIHHLHTPVKGTLNNAQGVLPLVEALHPTPALGGTPRKPAMQFIQQHEPVPRGWYAAPVGWIDHHLDGVFGVAIRSAVAQNNRVWAYAGAGIVADSEPAKEWAETAVKFRPMLNSLGIANGQ